MFNQYRCLLLVFTFGWWAMAVYANQSDWDKLISLHTGSVGYARDEKMGILVNLNHRSPFWASAIDVCQYVFSSVREGKVPSDAFYDTTRVILEAAFKRLLIDDLSAFSWRYGLPERKKSRMIIPVRVSLDSGDKAVVYGHIYMVQVEDQWFIEQWAVDLSF